MWISWDDHENVSIVELDKLTPNHKFKNTNCVIDNNYTRELINENKKLWIELKEKNEIMISLRDDIYFKERTLESLEKYKEEMQHFKNDEQYLDLIREINQLKTDQREKQTLVNFLNEMIENLCDEVLQNEHVESLEAEISLLEIKNKKLSKENSEIKVKLKIVEYDNDKLHTRLNQIDEENYTLKKKLEKASKKVKDKENSMLSFKKFSELANNLQSRISRSKYENQTLKNVIERMRNVANNYERLENENRELKRTLDEMEMKNAVLKDELFSLQETQLKMNQSEMVTKPVLVHENQELKQKLRENEQKIETLVEDNAKLKTNLKIYEKILIENKAYIKEQEMRSENINSIVEENDKLKSSLEELNKHLNKQFTEKTRIFDENESLRNENKRLSARLEETNTSKQALLNDIMTIKRCYEGAETEIEDLKKQLQIYKNTVQNQNTTLKLHANEMDNILKENKELKLKIKQYESQIQMEGKVYKIVR